jgi:hypothetical protein
MALSKRSALPQRILGHAAHARHLVSCYGEIRPAVLIDPNWVEEKDSPGGYLDRYFDGWINPRDFRLLDAAAVSRLLVAYIDDARAADNLEALRVLEQAETSRSRRCEGWCCQTGLNCRPLHYQWSALPLSYGSMLETGINLKRPSKRGDPCHKVSGHASAVGAAAPSL